MLLTTLLALSPAVAPAQDAEPPAPATAPAPERTAEGVEVLRRILADALNTAAHAAELRAVGEYLVDPTWPRTKGAPETATQWLATPQTNPFDVYGQAYPSSQAVSHSRGFHLPGAGLFYSFDASVRARQLAAPEEPARPTHSEADDVWERVRGQVRDGHPESAGSGDNTDPIVPDPYHSSIFGAIANLQEVRWRLDQTAIEEMIDGVLEELGLHARRVEGLADEEFVTVALHLSASKEHPLRIGPQVMEGSGPSNVVDVTYWSGLYGVRNAPDERVVVRARVGDLRSFGQPGVDVAALRRLAQVHRY